MSSYSVDKNTRIPLTKLWSIRRYSDYKKGKREAELLGKSLRWGLTKAGALVALILVSAVALAARLSISEGWEPFRLSDGHTRGVRQIALSPDGQLLVSVGEDSRAIVWDFLRREPLATLTDHTDRINAVAFSPDGKYFATGSQDRKLIVWNAASLHPAAIQDHSGPVINVAFSPESQLLATASSVPDPLRYCLERGPMEKGPAMESQRRDRGAVGPVLLPGRPPAPGPYGRERRAGMGYWKRLIEHREAGQWNSGVRALSRDGSKMITVGDNPPPFHPTASSR